MVQGHHRARNILSPEPTARGVEVDAYVRRVQELVDRAATNEDWGRLDPQLALWLL